MKRHLYMIAVLLFLGSTSCKKYLDEKPQKSMVVPSTLADLQSLLDLTGYMNNGPGPGMLDVVADDYYITSDYWGAADMDERKNYIWQADAEDFNGWAMPYGYLVYYSNIVLDQLATVKSPASDKNRYDNIRGSALFYRSFAFHGLAQLYCRPFSNTAGTDPGIVLKLSGDVNERSVRSTVQQTYDKLIQDLTEAADLLPALTQFPTRPGKAAVYGLLARVYLSMRDYPNAARYADLCLDLKSTLINYNTVPANSPNPFRMFNNETIYYSFPRATSILYYEPRVDSNLYASYHPDDLRKTVFFEKNTDNTWHFKGSYAGEPGAKLSFDGITTSELWLIKAECAARAGHKDPAMTALNTLLENRWVTGSFQPVSATDPADALNKVLAERRKELCFRGVRWSDLRRFNLEGSNITLKRIVDGTTYTLPPNDPRWVLLIPYKVINISGMAQNPR